MINEDVLNSLDQSIIPLIRLLNENGVQTLACCSGFGDEHNSEWSPGTAYVLCADSKKVRMLMAQLMDKDYIQVNITSEPRMKRVYTDEEILGSRFSFYFKNLYGENMENVISDVSLALSQKLDNGNLEYINAIANMLEISRKKIDYDVCIRSQDSYILIQNGYIGNGKVVNTYALAKDVADSIQGSANGNKIYIPEQGKENIGAILAHINSVANRYAISKEEFRSLHSDQKGGHLVEFEKLEHKYFDKYTRERAQNAGQDELEKMLEPEFVDFTELLHFSDGNADNSNHDDHSDI